MSRYYCPKCGADRTSKPTTGYSCPCGGVYINEDYLGGLDPFMQSTRTEPHSAPEADPEIESVDRVVQVEDPVPTERRCPDCGGRGEMIGFESVWSKEYFNKREGYECGSCEARWDIQLVGGSRA